MAITFLQRIISQSEKKIPAIDIAVIALWFKSLEDHNYSLSVKELADDIVAAGMATQNISRLRAQLAKDSRTAKGTSADTFKIKLHSRKLLDQEYLSLVNKVPVKHSNSFIPMELHKSTRKYIDNVMLQINGSYDGGLYDCCAVMCRRLLETLIIEAYEAKGKTAAIQGTDGNFFMFQGLLNVILKDPNMTLGRNAKKGLEELKALGDKSAHNRRFNAVKNDLDSIRADVRTAAQELLHLANLV